MMVYRPCNRSSRIWNIRLEAIGSFLFTKVTTIYGFTLFPMELSEYSVVYPENTG